MKSFLLGLLCLAGSALAQTTVQGTLTYPFNGAHAAGCTITITGPSNISSVGPSNVEVVSGKFSVLIGSSGAYSFSLMPNDTLVPSSTSYTAFYSCLNGTVTRSETWLVPTSSAPVTISQIRVASPPPLSVLIPSTQISAVGIADGWCIKAQSGVAVWSSVCSSAGSILTGRTWPSMVGTMWTSLVGTTWQ